MKCLTGSFSCDDHTITVRIMFDVTVVGWCGTLCQIVFVTVYAFLVCRIIRVALLVEVVTTFFQRQISLKLRKNVLCIN